MAVIFNAHRINPSSLPNKFIKTELSFYEASREEAIKLHKQQLENQNTYMIKVLQEHLKRFDRFVFNNTYKYASKKKWIAKFFLRYFKNKVKIITYNETKGYSHQLPGIAVFEKVIIYGKEYPLHVPMNL